MAADDEEYEAAESVRYDDEIELINNVRVRYGSSKII